LGLRTAPLTLLSGNMKKIWIIALPIVVTARGLPLARLGSVAAALHPPTAVVQVEAQSALLEFTQNKTLLLGQLSAESLSFL
jgi:hypothetical protein